MNDGYPKEHELQKIKDWDRQDIIGLFEYVRDLWYYPDYITQEGRKIEMHTGGWSGNEEIVEVLQNTFFWYFCWEMSKRGGHYYFEIPKNIYEKSTNTGSNHEGKTA